MAEKEIQDFCIRDSWIDKTGEEKSVLRKVGVSIKLKGGGWEHKLYKNVSIGEGGLSLPRKERQTAKEREDAPEPGHDFMG